MDKSKICQVIKKGNDKTNFKKMSKEYAEVIYRFKKPKGKEECQ